MRVAEWRLEQGMVLDSDLADWFNDWNQAQLAGTAIAEAWKRCRDAENSNKGSKAAHAARLDSQRKPGREALARQKINSFRRQNARLAERAAKLTK